MFERASSPWPSPKGQATSSPRITCGNRVAVAPRSDAPPLALAKALLDKMMCETPGYRLVGNTAGAKARHSVGVVGWHLVRIGRLDNRQILVSVDLATDAAFVPVARRPPLPGVWADVEKREAIEAFEGVVFCAGSGIALGGIRARAVRGTEPESVIADYVCVISLREGLDAFGLIDSVQFGT